MKKIIIAAALLLGMSTTANAQCAGGVCVAPQTAYHQFYFPLTTQYPATVYQHTQSVYQAQLYQSDMRWPVPIYGMYYIVPQVTYGVTYGTVYQGRRRLFGRGLFRGGCCN